MELRYVVLTIIKILISVPAVVLYEALSVEGAALMGGHLDNKNVTEQLVINNSTSEIVNSTSEEIPDPSPLVLPGYNLPENIFNKGKPFYLEKDPVTGQIDFASKTSLDSEMYDYIEDVPSSDIYDKANIDRKDGPLNSHRPSDINQLTPNFHDFLNLPVKYNPDKYVYPLISSSYANTKIQGNINKYHNHKDYNVKTQTIKPASHPTYYISTANPFQTSSTSTSTTTPSTTTFQNMMSGFGHPNFQEEFEYYDETEQPTIRVPYSTTTTTTTTTTTKAPTTKYTTTKAPSTTTKRVLSVFEQLFGDYEDYVTEKQPVVISEPPKITTSTFKYPSNSHTGGLENSYEYEYEDFVTTTTTTTTTQKPRTTASTTTQRSTTIVLPITQSPITKVTSLPLGENHINVNNHQSIIVATQNLREQLNGEKVVPKPFGYEKGQQPPSTSNIHIAPDQDTVSFVVGNHQNVEGQYIGSTLKQSPYDSNPFRPLYGQPEPANHGVVPGSSVTIQPQKNSEASLAIGVPIDGFKQVPGQVVDEKLELEKEKVDFPKTTGPKIVFPDEKKEKVPEVVVPPVINREVLQLSSKPMYHQLPSDLTPPKEKEPPISGIVRPRPPWDPRPGHFYSGKPEYVRPPRPPPEQVYKRIDNLPNILPQFRPNMNHNVPPPYLNRQPLLERPSSRPIGFFEKLQPPPPPKNLHLLRKIPPPNQIRAEERIVNDGKKQQIAEQFPFLQAPPKVVLANRRIADIEGDVETLQMIQSNQKKTTEKKEVFMKNDTTDKPLYVVYPVNTPPVKMDVLDNKESVVIGTRAELPLPPSKINQYEYETPLLNPKDRNDSPILKPHPRPSYPIKSDFPYHLERPDPAHTNKLEESDIPISKSSNQISVTLKTYTEKPIAVAYTPTEPHPIDSRYSMPNYASPVIPEIRPGSVGNADSDNEFTVSAVMHTHAQYDVRNKNKFVEEADRRVEGESSGAIVPQLEFQAPFQASVNLDSVSQGWTVVKDKNRSTTEIGEEVTTLPLATTSEFDIENFKPELIGGFKPIYKFPEESGDEKVE